MSTPGPRLQWWDREVDDRGDLIRTDVRRAAHELWHGFCAYVHTALGDVDEAPALMESGVACISCYLNRKAAPPSESRAQALLKRHFCRELKRRASRLARIEAIGLGSDLEAYGIATSWVEEFNCWLDIQKYRDNVTDRSWITFAMRYLEHPWDEISEKLGIPISTAKNSYREDIRKVRALLKKKNRAANTNGKAGPNDI